MARLRVGTNLDSRLVERMLAAQAESEAAVVETADEIAAGAKALSRVRTGDMRDGWKVEGEDPGERRVVNRVWYARFNEYGTTHASAKPMVIPASEEARPSFHHRIREAYRR